MAQAAPVHVSVHDCGRARLGVGALPEGAAPKGDAVHDTCCPSSSNARWSRSRVRLQGGPWRHSDDISLSAEGAQADTADAMVDVMKQLGEVRERAHCIDSDIDLPLRIIASAKTEAGSSTLLLVQHAIPGTTQIVGRSGTSVTRLIGRRHPRASTMVILSC